MPLVIQVGPFRSLCIFQAMPKDVTLLFFWGTSAASVRQEYERTVLAARRDHEALFQEKSVRKYLQKGTHVHACNL